jgi:hypothetical protein
VCRLSVCRLADALVKPGHQLQSEVSACADKMFEHRFPESLFRRVYAAIRDLDLIPSRNWADPDAAKIVFRSRSDSRKPECKRET